MAICTITNLVIDMQNDFLRNNAIRRNSGIAVKNIVRLVKASLHAGMPTVYLLDTHLSENDPEFARFEPHCLKGTEGWEMIDDLLPYKTSARIIEKWSYSGFRGTVLDDYLKRTHCDTICLAGVQAHLCVLCTALEGYFHGYDVVVLEDCVASTSKQKKSFALRWIDKYCGRVIPLQRYLDECVPARGEET